MEKHLGQRLPPLVERVVASYLADPRTHYIDREYLPSRSGIIALCDTLLELTYPGYIGRHGLNRHNVSYHVGELLPRLWESLLRQIHHCLCHDAELEAELEAEPQAPPREPSGAAAHAPARPPEGRAAPQPARGPSSPAPPPPGASLRDLEHACRDRAESIATRFLEQIPHVRQLLADDVQAHYDGDPAAVSPSEIILAYPGMLAISLHRYAHLLHEAGVPYLPRIISEYAHTRTGIDIHPGARIGRSFCIDHGTGVVIGETTEIGDNVKIYQGVTLGALSFAKDERGRVIRGYKRHPTVGNNVTIYANAIILGGDTVIGDGAVIGGSVFLTRSIAPGHQVSLSPPVLKVRPPRPAKTAGDAPWSDYVI